MSRVFLVRQYESSFIMSKIPSKILNNENKKLVFPEKYVVCFGILIHVFVLKTTETPVFMFSLLIFFN